MVRRPRRSSHVGSIARLAASSAVVLIAATCTTAEPTPSPSPDPEQLTVYGQLFDRVGPDGETDVQLAVDAFSLAFKPLPGGQVPEGPPPMQHEAYDGTFAIGLIAEHWDELSTEQQAAVHAALTPGPNDTVIEGDDGSGNGPATGTTAVSVAGFAVGAVTAADEELRTKYTDALREAQRQIEQRVGRSLGKPWRIWMSETNSGATLAATFAPGLPVFGFPFPFWVPGCVFITYPATAALGPTELATTLTHEMWHCYQASIAPANVFSQLWLYEGQAEWAGEKIAGPSTVGSGWWKEYVLTLSRPLWERTYDATGFYWQLSELGIDPFTHARDMLAAFGNDGRFNAAGASSEDFLYRWAAGLVRDPIAGTDWNTKAIWSITDHAPRQEQTVSTGNTVSVQAAAATNATYRILAEADVVEVAIQGHALLGAEGSPSIRVGNVWLCTSGLCECPEGTHREGPDFVTMPSTFYVGVTGGLEGSQGVLTGHELREFCKPDPTPTETAPPDGGGSPCPGGCSSSTGEPHLTTVDAVGYDFQGAGEYVLLRSPDGSIEVQSRQVPLAADADISVNRAVAVRAGAHRVAIYVRDDPEPSLEVWLDGELVDATTPIDLGSGARVATYPDGVEVDLPDGSRLWAIPISGGCCMNILLAASEDLTANGAGLLGNVVPGGAGLPALPDGTRLPRVADHHERFVAIYEQLGPAWLVTGETSLFDYEPGQSTADFVVPGFPEEAEVRTVEDLPPEVRAEGELLCAPVTDPERFLECVFDVSVTDLIEWAEGYLKTVQLEEEGPVAIGAPPPAPPPDELPEGFVFVTDEFVSARDTELTDDGRLYALVRDAEGTGAIIGIDTSTGAVFAEAPAEAFGRIATTSDSIWVSALRNGFECVIERLDPGSLDLRATIPVPCDIAGAQFEPLGDELWFLDRTTADFDAHGGTLRRLDPATNAPGTDSTDAITVPFTNGYLFSSDDAIFWHADALDDASPDEQLYRLEPGATALESLGPPDNAPLFGGGRGVWTMVPGVAGNDVFYRTSAASVDQVLPIDGFLVGGDESAAWVSDYDGFDGTPVLVRYPLDGSEAQTVATGVRLDTSAGSQLLDYTADPQLAVGDALVAKMWFVPSPDDPEVRQLYLQATPVP